MRAAEEAAIGAMLLGKAGRTTSTRLQRSFIGIDCLPPSGGDRELGHRTPLDFRILTTPIFLNIVIAIIFVLYNLNMIMISITVAVVTLCYICDNITILNIII